MTKRTQKVIIGICILIAVACIAYLVSYYMKLQAAAEVYDEIVEEVYTPIDTTEEEEQEEVVELDIPIDFDALHEINPDVYGWIEIVGTDISYPLLQSATDDSYYLEHTIEGEETRPGTIYSEQISGQDFDVFNTILYGHNMSDLTMFGTLSYFRDEEYMLEHETIMIYTETAILEYQIYAAATFTDTHLNYAYDFEDVEDCQAFLDDTFNAKDLSKMVRDDVEVTTDDKILTLSTCIRNMSGYRLLVEAVLVDEQRAE